MRAATEHGGSRLLGLLLLIVVAGQCLCSEETAPSADNSGQLTSDLDPSTVIGLQVLFRHGHRTPEYTFPSDPNRQALEELGLAQLTNKGKAETLELGQYLRNRYSSFLNTRYVPRQVKANSSDTDRTIASALCVLAGCYPPVAADQVWKSDLSWQPIPVKMVPKTMDHMLYVGGVNCDRRNAIYKQDYRPAFNKENEDVYKYLSELTKFNVSSSEDVRAVVESYHYAVASNITIPAWMLQLKDKLHILEGISYKGLTLQMADKYMTYLGVGGLVGEIVAVMRNKTAFGPLDHKQISLYASHDTVLYGFLSILGVYNDIRPPLASAIMIELHLNMDSYFVQIVYRNDSSKEAMVLRLPNCASNPCRLEDFFEMTQPLIPKNVEAECRLPLVHDPANSSPKSTSNRLSVAQSLWIMFGVVAALALVIILAGTFVAKKTEYRSRIGYSKL